MSLSTYAIRLVTRCWAAAYSVTTRASHHLNTNLPSFPILIYGIKMRSHLHTSQRRYQGIFPLFSLLSISQSQRIKSLSHFLPFIYYSPKISFFLPQKEIGLSITQKNRTSKTRFELKDTNSTDPGMQRALNNTIPTLGRTDSGSLVSTSVNRHKEVIVSYQELGKQELPHNYHCFNLSYHFFTSKQLAASVQLTLLTAEHISKQ